MGETGENTDEWVKQFRMALDSSNMGWTFWPYKKMKNERGVVSFKEPENWDKIIAFAESDRNSFGDVRKNCPDRKMALQALNEIIENIKFANCTKNQGYIDALTK